MGSESIAYEAKVYLPTFLIYRHDIFLRRVPGFFVGFRWHPKTFRRLPSDQYIVDVLNIYKIIHSSSKIENIPLIQW